MARLQLRIKSAGEIPESVRGISLENRGSKIRIRMEYEDGRFIRNTIDGNRRYFKQLCKDARDFMGEIVGHIRNVQYLLGQPQYAYLYVSRR